MDRLGYTAMTAASRTMSSLTVRANNLANVNTPAFVPTWSKPKPSPWKVMATTAATWRG